MNMRVMRAGVVALLAIGTMGATQDGCQQDADNRPLAGVWSLQRGAASVTIRVATVIAGQEVSHTETAPLAPLNPADYPPLLADFIAEWNANIDDVNAALDAGLPPAVLIDFPAAGVIRLLDPADSANNKDGVISGNDYVFLGDFSGQGQANQQLGGLVVDGGAIEGAFNREALTTDGVITTTMSLLVGGENGDAFSIHVEVSCKYTGERTAALVL